MSPYPWRRRTPPRSRPGGVADTSKTPSLRAYRRLASPRLDDAESTMDKETTPEERSPRSDCRSPVPTGHLTGVTRPSRARVLGDRGEGCRMVAAAHEPEARLETRGTT